MIEPQWPRLGQAFQERVIGMSLEVVTSGIKIPVPLKTSAHMLQPKQLS